MQQTAGNAAVALMIQRSGGGPGGKTAVATAAPAVPGGLVQRRLNYEPAMLEGTTRARQFRGGPLPPLAPELFAWWKNIKDALTEYRGAYKAARQLALLKTMLALIIKWMEGNKRTKPGDADRAVKLGKLGEAIHLEIPNAERQASYMSDVTEQSQKIESQDKPHEGKFRYMSGQAPVAVKSASDVAEGGGTPEEAELMKQYDLSDAELAAIKIYTVDDFKYMNPAMAGNEGWLASQIPNVVGLGGPGADVSPEGLRQAGQEGRRHGEMAMEGLRKLPAWKGSTFRGLRLTPEKFREEYVNKKQYVNGPFLSTSIDQSVSEGFGSNASPASPDGKVGILVTYEVADGRNVAGLSLFPNEAEILLLPGATMTVTEVKLRNPQLMRDGRRVARVGAGITYDVTIKQESASRAQPKPLPKRPGRPWVKGLVKGGAGGGA